MTNIPRLKKTALLTLDEVELVKVAEELNIDEKYFSNRDTLVDRIQLKYLELDLKEAASALPIFGATTSPAEGLITTWFRLFDKNSILTIVGTFLFIFGIVFTILYQDYKDAQALKQARNENIDIKNKISDLEEMETSLKNLMVFIDQKKNDIIRTEEELNNLRFEHENLEPIVQSEKDVIDALFYEQERRLERDKWYERLIGFGFGIIASLIATIIYGLFRRLLFVQKVNKIDS